MSAEVDGAWLVVRDTLRDGRPHRCVVFVSDEAGAREFLPYVTGSPAGVVEPMDAARWSVACAVRSCLTALPRRGSHALRMREQAAAEKVAREVLASEGGWCRSCAVELLLSFALGCSVGDLES